MDASLKWRAPYHKMRGTFARQGNQSIALTDGLTGLVRSNRNQPEASFLVPHNRNPLPSALMT